MLGETSYKLGALLGACYKPHSKRPPDGWCSLSLSDSECRLAKPRPGGYKLFDRDGLYLHVTATGGKFWKVKYRFNGKEKKLSIGSYPELSLADARQETIKARSQIQQAIDPCERKQEDKRLARYRASQTFELIAREWHERNYTTWTPRHAENILRRLEKDVFPQIGHFPITKLTPPVLLACLQKVEDNAPDLARRCMQMMGQVFRYAVVTGRAERDLTPELKGSLKKFKRKHFASIEIEDLPDLVKSLHRNDARLFRQTILATQLLMLTFVRTSELIQAKWTEFDLKNKEWLIPAERMKMRAPHIVPLSNQSIEILNELKLINPKREFVFPSIPRPQQPMSNATILAGLKRMGYNGRMTGHGFRALAMSTIKEKLGYRHEVVDRQLAHAPGSRVDRAYDRAKFLPERKKMMQEWADYIDSLL